MYLTFAEIIKKIIIQITLYERCTRIDNEGRYDNIIKKCE